MFEDLTGKIFGKLKVLQRDENKNSTHVYWICQCSCINKTIKSIRASHLKSGRIQSCGCLYKERIRSEVPPNKFDFKEDYKVGYTDKGQEFYYDICDADLIEQYSWYFDRDGYVVARINKKGVKLHKLITKTDKEVKVDHKNLRKYDNRRCNLRIASNNQNSMNFPVRRNNKSGVTGVGWHKKSSTWRARIFFNGKELVLGYFNNIDEATEVRRKAELKYFGEFAPQYER